MLKDIIKEDLIMLFNPDEFGEYHLINDESYVIVMDEDKLKELNTKHVEGLFRAEIIFHIRKSDLPGKPRVGKPMKFDLRMLKIISCIEESGVYMIVLGENKS